MQSRSVNSRLARREQQKLVRQTVILIIAATLLLVGFVFVILPQSVRLVGYLTGANVISDPSDTLPPQVPVLAAPPPATPSAQLAISGYGEAKSEVVLIVNASEQNRKTLGDDGQFTFDVNLTEGENIISVYAIDANKNESEPSRSVVVVMDSQPPKLEINEPKDGQQIELRKNQQLAVKGMTDPKVRVYVNDRLAFTQEDGAFSTTFQLVVGENILKVKAQDQAGNITEKELKVQFKL